MTMSREAMLGAYRRMATIRQFEERLHEEIGSSFYHGGMVYPGSGLLHPGKYFAGLAAAGVTTCALAPYGATLEDRQAALTLAAGALELVP